MTTREQPVTALSTAFDPEVAEWLADRIEAAKIGAQQRDDGYGLALIERVEAQIEAVADLRASLVAAVRAIPTRQKRWPHNLRYLGTYRAAVLRLIEDSTGEATDARER